MSIRFPLVIVGSQWGDEGKGKVVDILSSEASHVVRYNGGNNAGHTVVLKGEKYKLSLLPSGVLHNKNLYLSQGVVIDPKVLIDEISFFEKRGIKVKLVIDPRVNIVMPYHKALDRATEIWKGKKATGSLHLGIGYCYEDKNNRPGIRSEDLINPISLKEKLSMIYPLKKLQIEKIYNQKFEITLKSILNEYLDYGKKLKEYTGDVSSIIINAVKTKKVLFEGAHGTFLDGIFGTYPYTTAVYTISGGVFPYVGLPPQKIYSMGIVKAYTTRVGNGPFPTKLFDDVGNKTREIGGRVWTVSKRPRRCGWLDLNLVRTAIKLSGFDYLTITKLDVLSALDSIKICTEYKLGSKTVKEVPASMSDFAECVPVYKEFKGWKKDISMVRKIYQLPKQARDYIKFVEKDLKIPVRIISVGAERNSNILL